MNSLVSELETLVAQANDMIAQAESLPALEQLKSHYLGKKGQLSVLVKKLPTLAPAERPKLGEALNSAKREINSALAKRHKALSAVALETQLAQEVIDITLPPRGQALGGLHPVTIVRKMFESFFVKLGFTIVTGPEIENEFYNFTALNIPPHHPSRTMHDTFYFADGMMLRSQTSPAQIHAMERMEPPLRIICPGRVFRRDNDATHAPMFHQLEMLVVDRNVNFSNLKWLINKFIEYFFKGKTEYRFRPSYFPFTEPSAEVDIKWQQGGEANSWLELGGCGVVHPRVLRAGGVDPKKFQGLAFGFGIDRLAMLYYGIKDIRMLFTNELQFLQQF